MTHGLKRHALALALSACTGVPASAQPVFDVDFGIRHDSNLTRAEREDDQEHDTAVLLGGRVATAMRVHPQATLTGEIGLGATWWTEFSDVSELAGDVGLRYRQAFGTDFEAPWVELSIAGVGLKYQDSDIRDGGLARAGLVGGRRFGTMFDARIGYAYQVRRATEDDVFDLEQHKAFGQVDAHIGPRWLVYGEVSALEGEIVSTATIPNPKVLRHANEVSEAPDRAFGLGRSPAGGRRVRRSYQLDAVVFNGEIGVNYPVRRGLALDLAANYLQAYGENDNQYNGFGVNASLLWQFR